MVSDNNKSAVPALAAWAVFAAGIVIFFIGAVFYKKTHSLFTAVLLGLSFIFMSVFFWIFSGKPESKTYINRYAPIMPGILALKLLITLILTLLGVMFYEAGIFQLAYLSFAAAITQLLLIFAAEKPVYEAESFVVRQETLALPARYPAFTAVAIAVLSVVFLLLVSGYNLLLSVPVFMVIAVITALYFRKQEKGHAEINGFEKAEYVALALIFLNAVFVRLLQLDTVPPGYTQEARTIMYFVDLVKQGRALDFFYPGTDMGSFYYHVIFWFDKVFNSGIMGIRGVSVVLSLFSVVGLFLLAKELYNKKTALLSAAVFAMMFLNVNYSRLDSPVYTAVFAVIFGIYFLVMGIKRGEPVFYVLSGLMAAFSMYTYAPGRMVIPAVFLIFVMLVVDTKKIKDTLSNFNGLFLFSAAAIIAAVPVIYYMTSAGSGYFSRAEYYSLKGLNLHEQYISQLITYIFSFFTSGSVMAAENLPARPLLHGLEAVLFLAGFAYVLAFFRKKENAVLLIWFFVSLIPGMFFASSARPSFFRIITALPCIAIFIGIGAYCIYNLISAVFVKNSGRIFWGIFITVFAYTSIITYNDYFFRYPADGKVLEYFENAGAEVESMAVKNTARGKDVFVSAYYNQLNRGFCSFCREKNKLKIVNPGELALSAFYGNKDTVIITEGIYADALKILGEYFPDIKITAVKNSGSSEIWIDPAAKDYKYVKAEIPKKNIDVLYGLKAEYYSGRNSVKSDIFKGAINPDGTFDSVILSGLIEMPDYASVKIDFENAAYSLEIDGNKYDGSRLYRGLHTFTARIEPKSSGLISSYWQLENGKRTSIPVSCMINSGRFFGLIAKYAYNFNDQSAYQLEPQINTRFYNSSKPAIIKDKLTNEFFSINWKGYFNAENDGNYMFELKTADHFCNAIWLNGTLVYSRFGQEAEYGAVNLKKGWNKIEIISYSQAYDSLDTVYILKAKKYEEKEYTAVKYTELKPFLE